MGKRVRNPKDGMVGRKGKHPENALTPVLIRHLKEAGLYCDGNGLYLEVGESGSKSWVVRTTIHGKRHEIGVGSYRLTTLAEAREKAIEIRKSASDGGDPLAEKLERMRLLEREHRTPTFELTARDYHRELSKTLTSEKHKANWMESLEKWVFPSIGKQRIDRITSADILKILTPIWTEVPERAKRTKQRIAAVMSWAKAAGFYCLRRRLRPLGVQMICCSAGANACSSPSTYSS